MRILFALAGLHKFNRGAEIAFISLANELTELGDEVTLIGAGDSHSDAAYRYLQGSSISREQFERFPSVPIMRSHYVYEEATFLPSLLRLYRPIEYDITVTCAYPFTNWALRRPAVGRTRPPHIFVTQNGDWPATAHKAEWRAFHCEGLVCINPDFLARNQSEWNCCLIPNGVDTRRFTPGAAERQAFKIDKNVPTILMVSALIPSKRVEVGIKAVARIEGAQLVVAGDGPMRSSLINMAKTHLPGRFTTLKVTPDRMPALYRSADVVLHLSQDEPFGNVFIEAMACGIPVVAHDTPRARWITKENEHLINTNDVGDIAGAISEALKQPKEMRKRLEIAAGYSWKHVAGQYRAFFEAVIANYQSK